MPPLRKKWRGGGGGKTEAPFPDKLPGISPSIPSSIARKERERKMPSSSLGDENLGMFVSRSFQKERGEKKLLEASRTSLRLTSGTFQKSMKPRKIESSSSSGTPKVANLTTNREQKEKRLADRAQRISGFTRSKSNCRGRLEPVVCRSSCRELGEDRIVYRRTFTASEEKLVRRVIRRDETSAEHSTRYTTVYHGKLKESQSYGGGASVKSGASFVSQRVFIHPTKSSIVSPNQSRRSPCSVDRLRTVVNSSVTSLPVKSSCKCGASRTPDTGDSPGLLSLDERRRWASSITPLACGEIVRRNEAREQMPFELTENLKGTLSHGSGAHGSANVSCGNTPDYLQGRLALLEGRVSQIAAELKATKDLLNARNPACPKGVLKDIQLKISGIEKAINYRLAKQCGLTNQFKAEYLNGTFIEANEAVGSVVLGTRSVNSSINRIGSQFVPLGLELYGKLSRNVQSSRALTLTSNVAIDGLAMPAAEPFSYMARVSSDPAIVHCMNPIDLPKGVGGSAPSSHIKPALDNAEFAESLPHTRVLPNRPLELMENRAALHQKLVDNDILLRSKLAALEERDGVSCSGFLEQVDVGSAEFITALKQSLKIENELVRGKSVQKDFGSSRAALVYPGNIHVDSFRQGSPCGSANCDRDLISSEENWSLKEGRRSPSSGKTSSRILLRSDSFAFHPLARISSRNKTERRRSLEKRKSFSVTECCSPEPVYSGRQIVMLEPIGKISNCQASVFANHTPSETFEVDFAETLYDDDREHVEDVWFAEVNPENLHTSDTLDSPRAMRDEGVVSLGCEESLSPEDLTLHREEAAANNNDEEQVYLGEREDAFRAEMLHRVGDKIATAGWFVSDGEGILLAHDDACCSFFDTANMEGKSTFKSPVELLSAVWRDCWLIRAASSSGACNKYVVAATTGRTGNSAFCSWEFYSRRIAAFHSETSFLQPSPSPFSFRRSVSNSSNRRSFTSRERKKLDHFTWYGRSENAQVVKEQVPSGPLWLDMIPGASCPPDYENLDIPLWWYRPCSPLIVSAGSGLKTMVMYDVRDNDVVMKWELGKSVACMELSCPIQWQNKGKLVVAEDQSISLWDVNTLSPHRLNSIDFSGTELRALHVCNSDAEYSGGVRERPSSRDSISGDGVLCTQDTVNIIDFRLSGGIALKIPTFGETAHSVSARGDSVFVGATACSIFDNKLVKGTTQCKIIEWSIKQGKCMHTLKLPYSSANQKQQSVAQVWGNQSVVMGVNSNGLAVFDSYKGDVTGTQIVPIVLGTDDLFQPTFDFADNRVLLISRDRPASWCHWP